MLLISLEVHAHEAERASAMSRQLSTIGSIAEVNAVSGDNSRRLIDRWVPHDMSFETLGDAIAIHSNVIVKMQAAY